MQRIFVKKIYIHAIWCVFLPNFRHSIHLLRQKDFFFFHPFDLLS